MSVLQINQENVDKMVVETRAVYNKVLEGTGEPQTMALMRKGNPLTPILAQYEEIRQHIISLGLKCPQLIEGLTVNLGE